MNSGRYSYHHQRGKMLKFVVNFTINDEKWTVEVPEGYTSKGRLAWRSNRPGCWAKNPAGKDKWVLATQDKYNHIRKSGK